MFIHFDSIFNKQRKDKFMKIIISPAKKMKTDKESYTADSLPIFTDKALYLMELLKKKSYDELKELWKCNDKIATQNYERLSNMDIKAAYTPAITAYEGIQYQYMAPSVFSYEELKYVKDHLYIISAFYGLLRPFDAVTSYRLEMQAPLKGNGFSSLYEYWNKDISDKIFENTNTVINLASKEYSKVVSDFLPDSSKFITCRFGELNNGKVIEKGTFCKMARGDMVRFMAETNAQTTEDIKKYNRMGYEYSNEYSSETEYVFIKNKTD